MAQKFFRNLFGRLGGILFNAFIIISCLGTLNGLMLACTRSLYSVSVRGHGPAPRIFSQLDPHTNMPTNSAIASLALDGFWLLYFYGANLTAPWFGKFCFDSSELPIVTLYGMYIPMFIMFMAKSKELNGLKRFVMPALAIVGSCFMVYAAFAAYGTTVLYYLIVFALIMGLGALYQKKKM